MRRRHAAAAAALAAAVLVGAGCGDTGDAELAAVDGDGAAAEVPATRIEVVATDHHFDVSGTEVAEGVVPIELVNDGESVHQLMVGRLDEGATVDDYLAAFDSHGESAANELLTYAGGVNAVDPGATAVGYADLEPGHHVILCFIPADDGAAHLEHGMVAELTVVPATAVDAPSAPAGEITLVDFGFALPEDGLASGTYHVSNEGQSDHEMAIMRLQEGASLPDVAAYLQGGFQGESPVAFVGGPGAIEAGDDGYVDLDLPPGDYLAMCFLPDEASGKRHVELGMLAQLTVE